MKAAKYLLISFCFIVMLASCDSSAPKQKQQNRSDSSQLQQNVDNQATNAVVEDKAEVPIATDTVVISGMKYNPEVLHVQKGATVIWVNEGIVPHDVTEFPQKIWKSDTIKVGQSWEKTIDASFDYFCSIHITMKGKIMVDK